MAEEENSPAPKPDDAPKVFTQAELDQQISARLKREREKYADYDDLKSKAAAADKIAESGKGEQQRLTEQLEKLQQDLADERRQRIVIEVAATKGLTPAHVKRLSGSSREELEASADELLEDFPIPVSAEVSSPPPGGKPREQLKPGSGDPDQPVGETDIKKLGERIFQT